MQVDRLYGWKTCRNAPIGKAIKQQSKDVMIEFNMRLTQVLFFSFIYQVSFSTKPLTLILSNRVFFSQIITQFKEQGLNTELYYKNKEMGETYNIVPTSAIRFLKDFDSLCLYLVYNFNFILSRL